MTARLTVRPLLFDDEPAYGYLARWATQLGYRTPAGLAVDLGLDVNEVMRGRANGGLAEAANLPADAFDRSTASIDGDRVAFAGITVGERAWRSHSRRFCLRCLNSDRRVPSRPGYGHAHVRAWWDFDFLRGCPVHGVPLMLSRRYRHQLVCVDRSTDETDWGGPLDTVAAALPTVDVAFEAYLLGRMGFCPTVAFPFLDLFSVSEVTTILFMLAGMPGMDAPAKAFAAVREGPEGIDRFLTLQRRGNRITEPHLGYKNRIYQWLEQHLDDPRLEPLVEIVRRNARSHGFAQRFPVYLGEVQEVVRPVGAQCLSISDLCTAERVSAVDAVILLRALGVIAESVSAGEACIPPGSADGIMRKVLASFLAPGGEPSWPHSDLVALRDAIMLAPNLRGPRQAPSVEVCDIDMAAVDAVWALRGLAPRPEPGRITLPLRRVPTRIRSGVIRSVLEGRVKPVRMGPRPDGNFLDLCVGFDGLP